MLLGRRLLTPLRVASAADSDSTDAALHRIQLNDRFFCETMECIPPQYYFPTDEEENWLKSQPKGSKKYHRVRLFVSIAAAAMTRACRRSY